MKDFFVRRSALFFLVGIVLLSGIFFLGRRTPPVTSLPAASATPTISSIRAGMLKDIRSLGADAAYQHFKTTNGALKDFEIQHNAAHLFGESLYDSLGLDGVSVCDSAFNFGCYHGFFTRAVAAEGLDVVPKLDAACHGSHSANPQTCQHGLGHGILDYLGFTNLDKALRVCAQTNQPDPLAGCTSGVFMEYNEPLTTGSDGSFVLQARPMEDPAKPYDPCPQVAEVSQLSCYHELPQWWNIIYRQDFRKLGVLCDAVPDAAKREACFLGIGGIAAPSALYDVKKTLALCALMPSRKTESTCQVYSAWGFVSNIGDRARGIQLCKAASAADQKKCPQ